MVSCIYSTYSIYKLCDFLWIISVKKHFESGYCSKVQLLQPFSAECRWWTPGLMKICIPLKKHDSSGSLK
jgi:hypothetical protein